MGDIITNNIAKINNILANKDLLKIFDSSYAIKDLKFLSYEFVTATQNLYNSFSQLKDNLLYEIDSAKKTLKNDVTKFLQDSHNLMFELFNKLTDLTNTLSGDKSRIAEISSYYLNYTVDSFYNITKNASDILDNYYKNEKELIYRLVSDMIANFTENSTNCLESYQKDLDEISEKLNNNEITIPYSSPEVYRTTISNIYNSKQITKEIIEAIKTNFENVINLQANGYFESQNVIDENSQTYGQISERAKAISYSLDNNELIDKTFDSIMTDFRDQFVSLLQYMYNEIKIKFPLQEDVLSSSFDGNYKNEIEVFLEQEKKNVITFVEEENKNYLDSVNNLFSSFKNETGKSLDQIISEMLNELTDLYLDNLNRTYEDALILTFQSINEIIENNTQLALGYLNSKKISSSYHITTGFKDKYNKFYNSFLEIESFVNNNLKNNLAIKFKNVINQIRSLLQSIKSNKILLKYYKQIPSAERHLNSIKDLFEIFNNHISDSVYNDNYLPIINKFISETIKNISEIKTNLQNRYNTISQKKLNDITQDYDVERIVKGSRYCCKRIWPFSCRRYCYYPDKYYYDGYNVAETNNHLNLTTVNFEEYIKQFDDKYNELYPHFSNNVLSYNNLLTNLELIIESKKNDFMNNENIYLNNIPQRIYSILEEKYGNVLLQNSYNYFKNEITNILPPVLDDISSKWAGACDKVYEAINLNKDKFKSPIDEFYYVATY